MNVKQGTCKKSDPLSKMMKEGITKAMKVADKKKAKGKKK